MSVHFRMTKLKGFIRSMHKQKVTKLGLPKLFFFPKVTKMRSIIWPQIRIDNNGVGVLRGHRHIPLGRRAGKVENDTALLFLTPLNCH